MIKARKMDGDPDRGATWLQKQRLGFPNQQKPRIESNREFSRFPNLPIGGTTGACHQSSAAIEMAATWYRANAASCEHPIIPALRSRFGLTPLQAIAALREARRA